MTKAIREGDATTTGGTVLKASGTLSWEDRRVARMGDPVWCPECEQVGFIAQGNPTFIDQLIAVATHRQAVKCGCADGINRLIASQDQLVADMDAAIAIPKDEARKARKRAEQLGKLRREAERLTAGVTAPSWFPAIDAIPRTAGLACAEGPDGSAAYWPDAIRASSPSC